MGLFSIYRKKNGVVPATLATLYNGRASQAGDYRNTGVNITLPAGHWQIYFYCLYAPNSTYRYTIWWDLCTSTTWSSAAKVGRVLSYPAEINCLSTTYASFAVMPTTTTTYYILGVVAKLISDTGSKPANQTIPFVYQSEARIWAIPVY